MFENYKINRKRKKLFKFYKWLALEKKTKETWESEWLKTEWDDDGFHSYINLRHATIIKDILTCLDNKDFQQALEMNGRRHEILKMKADAKREHELEELDKAQKKINN